MTPNNRLIEEYISSLEPVLEEEFYLMKEKEINVYVPHVFWIYNFSKNISNYNEFKDALKRVIAKILSYRNKILRPRQPNWITAKRYTDKCICGFSKVVRFLDILTESSSPRYKHAGLCPFGLLTYYLFRNIGGVIVFSPKKIRPLPRNTVDLVPEDLGGSIILASRLSDIEDLVIEYNLTYIFRGRSKLNVIIEDQKINVLGQV